MTLVIQITIFFDRQKYTRILSSYIFYTSRVFWTLSRQDLRLRREFATKHKSRQRRRNGMRAEADCFLAVNGGDGDVDTLWYPGVHIAARCIHNGHCHVIDPRAIREVGMHVLASVHIRIQLYAWISAYILFNGKPI